MLHCDKFLTDLFTKHGQTNDPKASVIHLLGKDAVAFAQAQFMNDVTALQANECQFNGWLSAKGKVQALFLLQLVDEHSIRLVLWDVPPDAFIDALMRFRFRAKVKAEIQPYAVFWSPHPIAEAQVSHAVHPQAYLCVMNADAAAESNASVANAISMMAHIPRSTGNNEAFTLQAYTPQMLGLARLKAYSTKKGCYPGQEIVARTHFLGKNKRSLVLLKLDGLHDIAPQTDIHASQEGKTTVIGHVLSSTHALETTWFQAVIATDPENNAPKDIQPALITNSQLTVLKA